MSRPVRIVLTVLGSLAALLLLAIAYGVFVLKPKSRPAPDLHIAATPATIERGRYLANDLCACVDCHTEHDWTKPNHPQKPGLAFAGGEKFGREDGMPGDIYAKNITPDRDTGIGAWTDGEISRAIREGVSRDGHALFPEMPYPVYRHMSDDDVAAIVAYLRSLPPVSHAVGPTKIDFPVSIFIKLAPKPIESPVTMPDDRGDYVLQMAGCGVCHTPIEGGRPVLAKALAGGFEMRGPWGTVWTSNITPEPDTGIGKAEPAAIELAIRSGRRIDGKPMTGPMPWSAYAKIHADDMAALLDRMKRQPPVRNSVPAPQPK